MADQPVGRDPWIGRSVAHYTIEEELGRGSAGVVYRAADARLDRTVAVKLLHREVAHDASHRRRFLAESRLAGALEHPSVLPVYEAGDDGGVLYIVTPYVSGTDLAARLAERAPLEVAETIAVVRQIAGALDAAHARDLVHRDVKPSNVLIGEADQCYLADFGLVKALDAAGTAATRTGQFVGTLDYCAPEQLEGADLDARADVYALGCVLYQCLTGSPPFVRPTRASAMFAHLHDAPPTVTGPRPELPRGFDEVIARALAKDPGDRFAAAGELAAAAEEAAAGRPGRVPPPRRRRTGVELTSLLLPAAAVAVVVALVAWVIAGVSAGQAPLLLLSGGLAVSLALLAEATQRATDQVPVDRPPPELVATAVSSLSREPGWTLINRDPDGARFGFRRPVNVPLTILFLLCGVLPGLTYLALSRRPQTLDLRAAPGTLTVRSTGAAARTTSRRVLDQLSA